MRKLSLFTLAVGMLCMSNGVEAQKIKREVVGSYTYTQLPSDVKLVGSKTYKVVGRGDYVDSYEKDKMHNAIKLTGYSKKDRNTSDVDFKVDIEKYSVKFGDRERESKVKTTKKDGVETKKTYYYYKVVASYKYIIKIYKNDEVIYTSTKANKNNIYGSESTSTGTALKSFEKEKKEYLGSITTVVLKSVSSEMNEKFCSIKKTINIRSAHLKPKKHKYDDYDASFEDMKVGYLIAMDDENDIDNAKVSLTKAIEGFTNIAKESDSDNKKARINKKITALLYSNIGHCYFLMKDYVAASKSYQQAMTYQKTFLDTKSMDTRSLELNKRVEANKGL